MKENDPVENFDLTGAIGISRYVKFCLDEYCINPIREEEVLERLKRIFSNDSIYQLKVLDRNNFRSVFVQRLGKRRLHILVSLLSKIDSDRYSMVR